jgi:hypothetical protein
MLKHRNPIITTFLSLIAASACHRLPISIGEGIDDGWHEPDGSGTAGTSSGGAGGGPAEDCEGSYLSCLESGEDAMLCRALLERCDGSSVGTAGMGGTGSAGAPGTGGAYPDGMGAAGAGGYPANGGAAGGTGLDECNNTYVLCLESGELPEICRDELLRCEMIETGTAGVGGGPAAAGSGNAGAAPN